MGPLDAISVIMPAYNAADTIVESIESVLASAFEVEPDVEVEVVIVDDGSTDGTADVVAARFGNDPRVRVHRHRVNRGGGAARNTAVDRARHEWMYCLDSDNLLDPPSFRELIAMASTGAWDVVAPAETRYFRGSPSEVTHSWHWDRGYVALADPLRMYETPVASGNYLFTLDAWARAGGYPEFAGSLDAWGFGLRVLFEGARFGVCPDTFYLHRQGHDSYYMRDNDDRRAIAAAQIILPGVRLLSERDRRRLLGDGALLEFFAHIPESPLHTDEAAAGPAARVVVTQSVRHQSPATTENVHRVRAAFSRAWAQAPPRATVRRLLKTFSRRGPGGDG